MITYPCQSCGQRHEAGKRPAKCLIRIIDTKSTQPMSTKMKARMANRLRQLGMRVQDIAVIFNLSPSYVRKLIRWGAVERTERELS